MRYCHFGVSQVNYSDSDSEQSGGFTFCNNLFGIPRTKQNRGPKRGGTKMAEYINTEM